LNFCPTSGKTNKVERQSAHRSSGCVLCDKHAVSCGSFDVAPGACPREETGSAGCESDKTSASTLGGKKRCCREAATSRRFVSSFFVVELKTMSSLRFTLFSHDASRILSFDQPNTNNERAKAHKIESR
ncbi:MAG TPA: hypothetical protein VEK74_11190, partial [Burkholderiaceae bacterium]|nr:hypothetical protein [Burkholderiaceae bacterium]